MANCQNNCRTVFFSFFSFFRQFFPKLDPFRFHGDSTAAEHDNTYLKYQRIVLDVLNENQTRGTRMAVLHVTNTPVVLCSCTCQLLEQMVLD